MSTNGTATVLDPRAAKLMEMAAAKRARATTDPAQAAADGEPPGIVAALRAKQQTGAGPADGVCGGCGGRLNPSNGKCARCDAKPADGLCHCGAKLNHRGRHRTSLRHEPGLSVCGRCRCAPAVEGTTRCPECRQKDRDDLRARRGNVANADASDSTDSARTGCETHLSERVENIHESIQAAAFNQNFRVDPKVLPQVVQATEEAFRISLPDPELDCIARLLALTPGRARAVIDYVTGRI